MVRAADGYLPSVTHCTPFRQGTLTFCTFVTLLLMFTWLLI
jgi:hypothetical protein